MNNSLLQHQNLTSALLIENKKVIQKFTIYKDKNFSSWNKQETIKAQEIEKDLLVCMTTCEFYLKFFEDNVPMSEYDEQVFLELTNFMKNLFSDLNKNLPNY